MKCICLFCFLLCVMQVKAEDYDLSIPNKMNREVLLCSYSSTKINKDTSYKQTAYWKKHKIFKGCGFGTLGLGLCGTFVGVCGALGSAYNENYQSISNSTRNDKEEKAFDIIAYVGVGLIASSIPLFILSNEYKIKAKENVRLLLNSSTIYMPSINGRMKPQPALSVCISF